MFFFHFTTALLVHFHLVLAQNVCSNKTKKQCFATPAVSTCCEFALWRLTVGDVLHLLAKNWCWWPHKSAKCPLLFPEDITPSPANLLSCYICSLFVVPFVLGETQKYFFQALYCISQSTRVQRRCSSVQCSDVPRVTLLYFFILLTLFNISVFIFHNLQKLYSCPARVLSTSKSFLPPLFATTRAQYQSTNFPHTHTYTHSIHS